ncbi:hypothetical protein [Zhihengliuella halotolerans]|uniref:Uncharacterized protein n=1 Tax=Zhihengliuella halotolerans TaxID=370736 RepID=A0A4Q8ADC4_9MICC|nr:hypothetical protein [Zhihengliuella halotolerans]RZU62232.1 hypothetical protein EV380_1825 [Zhihengliuella halotolerans]
MTDDAALEEEAQGWNLTAVGAFLSARSETDAETAWIEALPRLSEHFTPDLWGSGTSVNPYGQGAHSNLYNVECQRDFRDWLQSNGVTPEEYAQAVGPVQYVSFQMHLLSLMDRARSNKGWRVRVIGFPSLGVVACGLGSHYQGTQNHNQMGRASQLIRARALEVLTGSSKSALEAWPSASAEDWEERGLLAEPVLSIGDLNISTYDEGRGAKLRMVRNTTVKKELATFFAIKGMTVNTFLEEGAEHLDILRSIALELGRKEPYA